MVKTTFKTNIKNPAAQPFNVNARRNQTKSQSWWNPSSKIYWRNKK